MFTFYNNDNQFGAPVFGFEEGEGSTGGGDTSTEDTTTTEEEFDPESLDDKAKSYFQKTVNEAIAKAKADAKTEVEAEHKRQLAAAQRKAAKDKAEADGNAAEVARLAREEADTATAEANRLKAEAQADRDLAVKTRLVTKYNLADGDENRLLGNTPAEWEADAKELAKRIPVTRATTPKLEGGRQGGSTAEAQIASAKKTANSLVSLF